MKYFYLPPYQKILLFCVLLLCGQRTYAQGSVPDPINVTASQIFCATLDITLEASCSIGSPEWYIGSSPVEILEVSINSTTTYSVACIYNCDISNQVDVTFQKIEPLVVTRNQTICSGGPKNVQLTASCPAGIVTWYGSDTTLPAIGTGTIVEEISSNTDYNVRCQSTSPVCDSDFTTVSITVSSGIQLDPPSVAPTDSDVCGPLGYDLVATCDTGTPFFYLEDGLTEIKTMTIYPTTSGTYKVRCEDENLTDCPSDFHSFILTVTSPTAPTDVIASENICKGSSITLPANCDIDAVPVWYKGSSHIPMASNTVSPNTITTYRVHCASISSPGCFGPELTTTITPVDVITAQPASALVCLGDSVSFTVTNTGTYTYQWQKKQANGTFIDIPLATTNTLTINSAVLEDRTYYRCYLTGSGCNIYTEEAFLAFPQTIINKNKLVPSNVTALDEFGNASAVSDSLAVVGAFSKTSYKGTAYIYKMNPNGKWSQMAQITPSDLMPGDSFGEAVAISGDTVFVSAPHQDDITGAVYIYNKQPNNTWIQTDKLLAPGGAPDDHFGGSIAVSGSLMAIGADGYETVFIYKRNALGVWEYEDEIYDGEFGSGFGFSVGVSGNSLVIGAPGEDDTGAIFTYERDGAGDWIFQGKLAPGDLSDGAAFGFASAISGNTIIASGFVDPTGESLVQVYERDFTGNWAEKARLTSEDVTDEGGFGYSVAIRDNVAVIGAPGNYVGRGAAIVFERNASGNWVQKKAIIPNDLIMGDLFGSSVSISKTSILTTASYMISSPFPTETSKGGAYFYSLHTYPVPAITDVTQVAAVCSAQKATFNLTGLPSTDSYTITYKIDVAGTEKTATITPDSTGRASFSETVIWDNNTRNLFITKIKNNVSNCEKIIDVQTEIILKAPTLITEHPSKQVVCIGESAMFMAGASGEGALTFQWQRQAPGANAFNTPLSNEFSDISILTLLNRTMSDNGASYRVKATGECGVATSDSAPLTVLAKATAHMAAGPGVCPGTSGILYFSGTPEAEVFYVSNGLTSSVILGPNGQAMVVTNSLFTSTTFDLVSINIEGKCNSSLSGSATIDVLTTGTVISPALVLTSPTNDVLNTIVQNHLAQNIHASNKINTGGRSEQKGVKHVLLEPGFEAAQGSVFLAKAEPACP